MTQSLETLRHEIDTIDDKLLQLIITRMAKASAIKQRKGTAPIYRPEREAVILRRLSDRARGSLSPKLVQAIYTEIIAACRNHQQPLRVAYLGPAGSYSHEAVLQLVGSSSKLVASPSLSEALRCAEAGETDTVLLPIENSSEGMVVETHRLLRTTILQIIGETRVTIRHCLLSKATSLHDVTQVLAHPQALGQCREWLHTYLPQAELVAQTSNSRAAELVVDMPQAAAIASSKAGELFGLPVLAGAINDQPTNQTRFVLLGKHPTSPSGKDKTSLLCMLRDKPGTLHTLLALFATHNINLVRLESQPASPSDYIFYLDAEGHQAESPLREVLDELTLYTKDRVILGSYPETVGI
jgi:chorismate mutase/prephenate dehydratase